MEWLADFTDGQPRIPCLLPCKRLEVEHDNYGYRYDHDDDLRVLDSSLLISISLCPGLRPY